MIMLISPWGFGPHMPRVMLNAHGATSNNVLTRFVHQGCPLSPFLFAIVTPPFLVMLSRFASNGNIVALLLPFRESIGSTSFCKWIIHMLLWASLENHEKGMIVCNQFALHPDYILICGILASSHVLKEFGVRKHGPSDGKSSNRVEVRIKLK